MRRIVKEKDIDLALVADSGLAIGSIYPINECRLIIGRRVDAAIPIDDVKASRDHAVLDRRNGHCIVVDLGSTNGTYVNGRKISEATRIKVGDHLRIGNSAFRVDLYSNVQERLTETPWNEETRVDLQLEIPRNGRPVPPKAAKIKAETQRPLPPVIEEKLLEAELAMPVLNIVPENLSNEITKKRIAFAFACLALICSAIFFF